MFDKTKDRLKKAALLLAVSLLISASPSASMQVHADEYREYPYDVNTPWTNGDVEEMLEYACQWEGRIRYASSQNNTDPDGERFEELHDGGATDCSWFIYHVLYRYGLVGDEFIHSYERGNDDSCYPGAYNIGSDVSYAVPGDIICTGEGTKPQNSHVAIYIGYGKVVECAAGHGVIISDAPDYARDIVHFDRIPTGYCSKTVDTE